MRIKDGYSQFWMMLSQESVDRLTQPRHSTRTAPSFRECHERVVCFCGNAQIASIETINLHLFVEY
jgi:precorrin isomerase